MHKYKATKWFRKIGFDRTVCFIKRNFPPQPINARPEDKSAQTASNGEFVLHKKSCFT